MRISFDLDGCLSEPRMQKLARKFSLYGHEIWILTSRDDNWTAGIDPVINRLNLPKERVFFTNGKPKFVYYFNLQIDIHFDNDWREVSEINRRGGFSFNTGITI